MFKRIMKLIIIPFLLIIVGVLSASLIHYVFVTHLDQQQMEPIPVSLVQLIANPTKFDGKDIITEGYLKFSSDAFENRLYLNEQSSQNHMSYNSIKITIGQNEEDNIGIVNNKYEDLKIYNENYVYIRGIFSIYKFPVSISKIDKTVEKLKDEMILTANYYDFCISDSKVEPNRKLCAPRYIVIEDPSQK